VQKVLNKFVNVMEVLSVMDWTIGLDSHGNYYSGFVNHLEQVLESQSCYHHLLGNSKFKFLW